MNEVIRKEKAVKWPVSHLVQTEVVLLLWVWVFRQAVDLGQGCPDDVVDDAAQLAQLGNIVELPNLHDVARVFQPTGHASRLHLEARGIRHDSLLEADL